MVIWLPARGPGDIPLFIFKMRILISPRCMYGTWLCHRNGYSDTLDIRILMKFCNPAFLEIIIGNLTCGTPSATDAIMDELG
jgi:hypothetical protein